MKRKEIENQIKKEISNSVPDVLEDILIKCENMKGFRDVMEKENISNKTKKSFSPKLVGALAMAMICLCGVFGGTLYTQNYAVDSIVEFDVNPSIELKMNKNEKIVDAVPLNEDGKKIIGNMELKNTNIDVATNAIVGSMLKNGYISNDANSILVSVKNDNEEKAVRLQEKIATDIDKLLKASSIDGAILTQSYDNKGEDKEVEKTAKENNLSEGKTKLINQILKTGIKDVKGNKLTFEGLSKLSINELNVLLSAKNTKIEKVTTSGTASKSAYIGEEKAKSIAYDDAKVQSKNVSRVRAELDYDDGMMIYEVDFYVGSIEYEYEINARTGAIVGKSREYDEKDDDDDDDDINERTSKQSSTKNSSSNNTSKQTNSTVNNKSQSTSNSSTNSNNTATISKEKAKSIAFSDAKVQSKNVSRLQVELDRDDGRLVYEISFNAGNIEYDYEINAKTGSILKRDKEYDDD